MITLVAAARRSTPRRPHLMRFFYRPFGFLAGIVAGLIARTAVSQLWERIYGEEPPGPTTERASWRRVVAAAALQGLVFRATWAATNRAGAKAFAGVTGVWPGEREPDPE